VTTDWQARRDVQSAWLGVPWLDTILGEVLSWLAVTSSGGELEPEVHLELAELYGLLAKHYRRPGFHWLSRRLAARSAAHWQDGGGDHPPRAVALALSVPDATHQHGRKPQAHGSSPSPSPTDQPWDPALQ
jgi:hypothetical protein